MEVNSTIKNAIVLGALSGSRTNAGLLFTGLLIRKTRLNYFSSSPLVRFFYNKNAIKVLALSGTVELVMDKLPSTPNRTAIAGLAGRTVAGAVCGATISSAAGKIPLTGALAGGIAALASTYALYFLRKNICKATGIPDPFIGASEDVLAFAVGSALITSKEEKVY